MINNKGEEVLTDSKGRYLPGSRGHSLSKEEQRKGGQASAADRIARLFKMFDAKPLTADEAVRLDQWLLTRTKDELKQLLTDDQQPIVVQARAQQLMERKLTFEATERMYDRAFGKPTQRNEVLTEEIPPIIVSYVDASKEEKGDEE